VFKIGQVVANKIGIGVIEDISDVRIVIKRPSANELGFKLIEVTKEQADRLGMTLMEFLETTLHPVNDLSPQDVDAFKADIKKVNTK
jgi:ferredoxin-fold anticodon binding domain-containing protein